MLAILARHYTWHGTTVPGKECHNKPVNACAILCSTQFTQGVVSCRKHILYSALDASIIPYFPAIKCMCSYLHRKKACA